MGYHSIALAQALQFDCKLRQKDVIGEWVPLSEPGNPDLIYKNRKWVRGLRWSQIDENLILRHTTSWGEKPVEISLRNARLVLAEFARIGVRPLSGPVIVYEGSRGPRRPYSGTQFRSLWRKMADAAGISEQVKNEEYGHYAQRARRGRMSRSVAAAVNGRFQMPPRHYEFGPRVAARDPNGGT